MKRSMRFGLFGCAILTGLTGCTTYYKENGADYLTRPENQSRAPYYTTYEVADSQTTGRGNASVIFFFFQVSDGKYCQLGRNPHLSILSFLIEFFSPAQKAIDNAKNAALYNACEKSSADQLLGTVFEYQIKNYLIYSSVECEVRGFPASVSKVTMIDKKPLILNSWQRIEYVNPHVTPEVYSGPQSDVSPGTVKIEK